MPGSLPIAAVLSTLVLAVAMPSAGRAAQDPGRGPDAGPAQEAAPAAVANPMARLARMVGGEWKMTAAAGTDLGPGVGLADTWSWGPGRHSLSVRTDGTGGDGNPWRALRAVYWHPGRKQIRSLELSPFAAGVAEGVIRFDGEALDILVDMYQTGQRRNLKTRWTFDGPDRYHDELLESTGPEGYLPMAAWNRVRVAAPATPRPLAVEGATLPEHLKAFAPLLRHPWQTAEAAPVGGDTGGAARLRSTFEWVPLANGICVRTLALTRDGEPRHLLDAYLYHHTGANVLRCLALSDRGGVYEGDVTVLDGGAVQLDLKGFEGDRVVPYAVRFDFEPDGTLRQRVWSLDGAGRTLRLDVRHQPVTDPPPPAR